MCTVTYIPAGDSCFILTSNRDEEVRRPASPPVFQVINKTVVWFPKDLRAGGTWIATSESGRTCCLLNGGYEKHVRGTSYKKSRGQIVLDNFRFSDIRDFIANVALTDVEPFTLIVAEMDGDGSKRLYQFVWDGQVRHLEIKNPDKPYLWSSVTLYDHGVRRQREETFDQWISADRGPSKESILRLHSIWKFEEQTGRRIQGKQDALQTVSITQVHQGKHFTEMRYADLLNQSSHDTPVITSHGRCLQ